MPDIDVNALMSAAAGGGAVWAAIRTEIKFLWRTVDKLEKQVDALLAKKAT